MKKAKHIKNSVVRITLTNADGTFQEIPITDRVHFLFGFATVPSGGEVAEFEGILRGDVNIVSEIFYGLGVRHPVLFDHCARRVVADAFKNAPVVGGIQ